MTNSNADRSQEKERASGNAPMSDDDAQPALDRGTKEKIDRKLDELDVSTTETGKDQTHKPDTEGSNSSSKNLDEQSE